MTRLVTHGAIVLLALTVGAAPRACAGDDQKTTTQPESSDLARTFYQQPDLANKLLSEAAARKGGNSAQPAAKDLRWVPERVVQEIKKGNKPPEVQQLAVEYRIRLRRGNVEFDVTEATQFRQGDRIRFLLRANRDVRARIVQHGTTGSVTTLFPDTRINNGSDALSAGQECAIPATDGWWEFDATPGIEHLTFILTPREKPAREFEDIARTRPGGTWTISEFNKEAMNMMLRRDRMAESGNSKDLFFRFEQKTRVEINTKSKPGDAPGEPAKPGSGGANAPTQGAGYVATTTVDAPPMLVHLVKLNHGV